MNPHPSDSDSNEPTASRASQLAIWASIGAALHLMVFVGWVAYDVLLAKHGGCFTGEGLFELLLLTVSFTCFATTSLVAAVKAKLWRLATASVLVLAPVLCIAGVVVVSIFF